MGDDAGHVHGVGGDAFDNSIMQFIKKEHSLMIGERTAEEIKVILGSAYPLESESRAEVRGRDLVTGLPRVVTVTTEEIREGLEEPVAAVCDAVRGTLDHTPPELAADIIERGIMLAGGAALLRNLDQRMADETGMPITVAKDPLHAVVRGSGHVLEHLDQLTGVITSPNTI